MSEQIKINHKKIALIGFYGLLRKECQRFLRIWPQTLLPPAITLILYFLIFGTVMGARVGQMSGVPYAVFITPGLIMMPVMMNAYMNVVSSFYSAKFTRSIEEILVSPMPDWLMLLGYCSGGSARGICIALIAYLVSAFFAGIHIAHPVLFILGILLISFLFSLAGFFNALFSRNFDDTTIVTTFVLTPLTYLAGIFYSISLLPPFWRHISLMNPIYYFVDIFRYSLLGLSDCNIYFAMSFIILILIFLFFLNLFCLRKGYGLKG